MVSYMLTSSCFPFLNWGIFFKLRSSAFALAEEIQAARYRNKHRNGENNKMVGAQTCNIKSELHQQEEELPDAANGRNELGKTIATPTVRDQENPGLVSPDVGKTKEAQLRGMVQQLAMQTQQGRLTFKNKSQKLIKPQLG